MGFDRIFVQAMDRFVWCLLVLVTTNCMLRIVTAHDKVQSPVASGLEATASDDITNHVLDPPALANPKAKPQIMADNQDAGTAATSHQPQQTVKQPSNQRIQFFDTIFNIPIQTLKAVNELVQHIAHNYAGFPATPAATPEKLVDSQYQPTEEKSVRPQ